MPENSNPSDDDLLRRMQSGSEAAFTELYRRHHGPVYRYALQMSGSAGAAEEVAQEVFLTLIRAAGRYDSARGSVSAWLFGIARKHVLKCLERDGRYSAMEEDAETEGGADRAVRESVLDDLTRTESLESLRQAVLALPAPYREAIVLCDLQEMSYEEAARVLECAVGTVRSRLHRGRALLAQRLGSRTRCPA